MRGLLKKIWISRKVIPVEIVAMSISLQLHLYLSRDCDKIFTGLVDMLIFKNYSVYLFAQCILILFTITTNSLCIYSNIRRELQ